MKQLTLILVLCSIVAIAQPGDPGGNPDLQPVSNSNVLPMVPPQHAVFIATKVWFNFWMNQFAITHQRKKTRNTN